MKITVVGRKVNLKDNFKTLVTKKLSKFERIFDEEAQATVTATLERNRQIVEITIRNRGMIYRAEASDFEMNDALDQAVSAIGRQIRKNKTRLEKQIRSAELDDFLIETKSAEEENEDELEIVKVKKFRIAPMTAEEALLQMNLLGHQFFMFRNVDTEEINVVYKRKDEKYGLLEPENN